MNEKPEALRLADRMAEGTGLDTQWDAAKELRRLHAENERLREEVRNWKKSFVGHVYVKNEDYAELISKRDALKTENERLRELLRDTTVNLGAAVSLLKNGGKKTAASDKMFEQMLVDYTNSFERGRAALQREDV